MLFLLQWKKLMKKSITSLLFISLSAISTAHAVDADEIVSTYFENTGGVEAWNKISGVKMLGEVNQGGMKFPFEVANLDDGRQYLKFSFQGKEMKQNVFDGENMWSTNFMTMKPEAADAEATANQKLESNDFPQDLLGYKEKGYGLELLGEESRDGAEVYKLKLTKEPITIDGKLTDSIAYYYFDKDAMVPLVVEAEIHDGPAKGKIGEVTFGDYQEVDRLYFPFTMTQGVKDMAGGSMTMVISSVVLNPVVADAEFNMPKADAETAKSE